MRFEFATATRIVFGVGAVAEAASSAAGFGRRTLLVRGNDPIRTIALADSLTQAGLAVLEEPVTGEPTVDWVRSAAARLRPEGIDTVLACGGGSVLDGGKALAAMLANPGDPLDYLEVIGKGQPLSHPAVPFIAIPTTAGTGAEVTRNAVLGSPEHQVKASLRSASMLPRLALIDPALAVPLPPSLTASTGLDALTQLIEPFVCLRANPMTDAFCRDGIPRIVRSLRRACQNGDDLDARNDMALASMLSGMALANAGLGSVHGLAAPIGGRFPAPHGAICAALLPYAMRTNLAALRERLPASVALSRYQEVAAMLTGNPDAQPEDGITWVEEACRDLDMPKLRYWGVQRDALPMICEQARQASSMKANPVALTQQETEALAEAAL